MILVNRFFAFLIKKKCPGLASGNVVIYNNLEHKYSQHAMLWNSQAF